MNSNGNRIECSQYIDKFKFVSVTQSFKQDPHNYYVLIPIPATTKAQKDRTQPFLDTKMKEQNQKNVMRVIAQFWNSIAILSVGVKRKKPIPALST